MGKAINPGYGEKTALCHLPPLPICPTKHVVERRISPLTEPEVMQKWRQRSVKKKSGVGEQKLNSLSTVSSRLGSSPKTYLGFELFSTGNEICSIMAIASPLTLHLSITFQHILKIRVKVCKIHTDLAVAWTQLAQGWIVFRPPRKIRETLDRDIHSQNTMLYHSFS